MTPADARVVSRLDGHPRRVFGAAWPLLAAGVGLAFSTVALLPLTWALLSIAAFLIPLVALVCGHWTRFFLALTILGFSVNLDKNLAYSGYVGGVAGLSISVVDIGLAVLLVSATVRAAVTRTNPPRLFLPITLPVLVLLASMTLSLIASRDLILSAYRLVDLAKLVLLYLLVAHHTRSEDDVRFMTTWLLAGIVFQGGIALFQYLQLFPSELQVALGFKPAKLIEVGPFSPDLVRPSGTIGHPNTLGAFLAVTLPVAISRLLLPGPASQKILPVTALAAGTTALVVSFSRGAWVSFFVASVLVLVIAAGDGSLRGRRVSRAVLVVLIVATVVFAFSGLVGTRIIDADQGATQNRMRMNRLAMQMIRANPAVGVGLHNFGLVMSEYDAERVAPQAIVHNVYLLVAAESGVGALFAFLWVMVAIGREGVRSARLAHPALSLTAAGMLGGLVGLWLQMAVEILIAGPPVQVSWFYAGVLTAMSRAVAGAPAKVGRPDGSAERSGVRPVPSRGRAVAAACPGVPGMPGVPDRDRVRGFFRGRPDGVGGAEATTPADQAPRPREVATRVPAPSRRFRGDPL